MTTGGRRLRADAARNRERLLDAASRIVAERGVDAPLEEIARQAGVSIGTLYNHFPTREALLDAVLVGRLASLDRLGSEALAAPDPWDGFAGFVEGLFALQAENHGLNDAIARAGSFSPEAAAACHRGFRHVDQIIARAREAGRLRPDFETADLITLVWAVSQVIRESMSAAPDAWRRFLAFFLDGLRPGAARPLPVEPLGPDRLAAILGPPPAT
ncbi:TetR/AcrR family transcriptional regulator [Bailinhaonella thermotolerans]|uniref:TetR/AcrR family transcriptional regulator n=1 Tax=Bailinhaonella thermotolerans TaxID=1070861 RepID=A0A3A4BHA0_9ACTN|nr:TetR/AcrR family transcriptional regulator [Bailinhaonella thermotolerans]RJL34162.1 TetR/AcrR family transcriptional regulator [Bailinhaonella thermotolerans]